MTDKELKAYRDANPSCELAKYFYVGGEYRYRMSYGGDLIVPRFGSGWPNATDLHHICGSGNGAKRVNVKTNVIHVCSETHMWLEAEKLAGFVLCLYEKRRKGELDWTRLNQIKVKHVRGWLDTDDMKRACAFSEFLERCRVQLLEGE